MIIVNQDKDMIVNFDNVENIDIVADLDGTGEIPFKIYFATSSSREELGKYKTEERAKEVLRDLLKSMNKQKFLMKPKINLDQKTIEEAKVYFENINGIDLIIDDNNFEIIPINKDNTIIYEMPEK